MSNTKICVYAIAKNEDMFVDRFMDSMAEADCVVVLDTGSTDNTVQKLRDRGAVVSVREINPWRFDVARNESMKLIPHDADVCVCVDLDEVFEPGWANTIRKHWRKGVTEKARYAYAWDHDSDGEPRTVIWYEKMHDNSGNWEWRMPVHEALTYKNAGDPKTILIPKEDLFLHHYPDNTKSRGQYLDLMRMATSEKPRGYMEHYYLGRELTFYQKWDEAVAVLEFTTRHLFANQNKFLGNQAAAYGFLGKSYEELGRLHDAETAFVYGAGLIHNTREPLINLMNFYYRHKRWHSLIDAGERAIRIGYVPTVWYEDFNNYGYIPHDLLAIGYWNVGLVDKGREHAELAAGFKPDDERLQANLKWFTGDLP